jgi:hypothetical protein
MFNVSIDIKDRDFRKAESVLGRYVGKVVSITKPQDMYPGSIIMGSFAGKPGSPACNDVCREFVYALRAFGIEAVGITSHVACDKPAWADIVRYVEEVEVECA